MSDSSCDSPLATSTPAGPGSPLSLNPHERVVPGVSAEGVFTQHVARYAFAAAFAAGKSCLDVACGTGYGAAMLTRAGAARVLGIEVDRGCVEYAIRNYGRLPQLEYRQGRAEALPVADGSIDLVVSFETLEHVRDLDGVLREIHRVLAPSGQFLLSTPNALDSCFPAGWLGSHRRRPGNQFHVREYTLRELRRALRPRFEIDGVFGQHYRSMGAFLALSVAALAPPLRAKASDAWHQRVQGSGSDVSRARFEVGAFIVLVAKRSA